ncbi:MAG: STAS domain-containing protein [Pseudomonadota bacterium]
MDMERTDLVGTVKLTGDLGIEEMPKARALLRQALDQYDSVVIDLTGAEGLGASFLQLLCSARRTARDLRKRISLTGTEAGEFERVAAEAGFANPEPGLFFEDGPGAREEEGVEDE